jgi:chromosomal replication initiation ATPase DnaA
MNLVTVTLVELSPDERAVMRGAQQFLPLRTITDPRILDIQRVVAERFGIALIEMRSRRFSSARPRQIAMYLSRILTAHSMATIGRSFGDRDPTTVLYAIRTIERLMAEDAAFAAMMRDCQCRCIPHPVNPFSSAEGSEANDNQAA